MSPADVRPELVVIACAVSAGIHGALVPEHFEEGTGAGIGFVVATAALVAIVVRLTRRSGRGALAAAAVLLGGLIASYGLAVTTGLPFLHPEPEPLEGLALTTKAVEAVGLFAAASLLRRPRLPRPKGTPA